MKSPTAIQSKAIPSKPNPSKMPSSESQVQNEKGSHKILLRLGAIALLGVIFGVPAVLIPITMRDVPIRSETKTITTYQQAIDTVTANFAKHELNQANRRLMPLPKNSIAWIQLINPMGRKAPGGGFAILEQANENTGAIGLTGTNRAVTVTLPAYRTLEERSTTLTMKNPADES
jgi:hypothetical protein